MRQVSVKSILWSLPILAVLLYVACMPWAELRGSDEAVYATVANEMAKSLNFRQPTFQGQPTSIFPLYPLLVCFFQLFHLPPEVAVRLPSVLAIFGMAAGAFLVARRHRDICSGAIAALIVLTAGGARRIGIFAQAETLHAALLSGAWFAWHTLGTGKQKWSAAWGVALGMVFLDMLNVGLRAVILFYLPLLFTWEPPRVRRFLRSKEHFYWLGIFALLAYLWLSCVKQPLFGWTSIVGSLSDGANPEGFFCHFLKYPFECFVDLLPWGLLFWVPFCLDLRKLEPTGSLCGFLRTTVLCTFIVYWPLPGHSPLFALAALPPMAVMTSFTLPIVFHRYEHFWKKVGLLATAVVSPLLFYAIILWLLCLMGQVTIADTCPAILKYYAIGTLLVLMGVFAAVLYWGHRPNSLGWAWLAVGMRLARVAIVAIGAYLTTGNRQFVANAITRLPAQPDSLIEQQGTGQKQNQPLAKDRIFYFITESTDSESCPAQLFYTGHPICRIQKADKLPKNNEQPIYLVAEKQPVFPGWNWEKLCGPVDFHHIDRNVTPKIWKTDWCIFMEIHSLDFVEPHKSKNIKPKSEEKLLYNLYKGRYVGTSEKRL